MNLYQLRLGVRQLLRDDVYPAEDIDAAINRVISEVNAAGTYRFHESSGNLTLVAGTFKHAYPTGLREEYTLVLNPESATEAVLKRIPDMAYAQQVGYFSASGTPDKYLPFGQYFWLDPIPAAADASKTVRVYGVFDLASLVSDMTANPLGARYDNVVIYGAVAQIAPTVKVQGGMVTAAKAYAASFKDMVDRESYKPGYVPSMIRSRRWSEAANWGNIEVVR